MTRLPTPRVLRQTLWALVLLAGLPGRAVAQEGDHAEVDIGFGFQEMIEYGRQKPQITFTPSAPVQLLKVTLHKGDATQSHTLKGLKAGVARALPLAVDKGVHTFKATFEWTAKGHKMGPAGAEFTIRVGRSPRIAIAEKDVDQEGRKLTLRLSEPAGKVELEVLGDDGVAIQARSFEFKGEEPGTPLVLSWEQKAEQVVGRFVMKCYDVAGFWSGLESVQFVNIPHEDIVFETAKWDIRKDEERKLILPLGKIQEELKKVQGVLAVSLYIGGYTDTVGSAADNKELSEKRARAIAAWFRKRGIAAKILYQGFGESVLFKPTPDNTDEQLNRRASYVLSTTTPPSSRGFPARHWKSL